MYNSRNSSIYTNSRWYHRTPPSLSSLCSADETSGEYKNWVALNQCRDNGIDPTQFSFRPSDKMIEKAITNHKVFQSKKETPKKHSSKNEAIVSTTPNSK